MSKLTNISLEGYKSIRQCHELAVGNLNVLIGANGSGKSNLISFFRLLQAAMRGELQVHVGQHGAAHSFLYNGPKVTGEISASLQFEDESEINLYVPRLVFSAPDKFVFASEVFKTTPVPGSSAERGFLDVHGAVESAVVQPSFRDNDRIRFFRRLIGGIRDYHFHDTSLFAGVRGSWRVSDYRVLYRNGENLPAVLRFLRDAHPSVYARILETIQLVAPFFADFVLEPPSLSPEMVMLNWRAKGSEYELGPHQLSDGTLRFIALATLLLQPDECLPDVLVIDEPELGLHPFAIKILASLLADTSTRTQVLVATQSVELVDEMEPEDIIVANMEGVATQFSRLDPTQLAEWLKDYTLSQMWDMNFIGGRP